MLTTHEDFKSIDLKVQDAEIMDDYVGGALLYQHRFDKRTTPWEKHLWKEEGELQNFQIDLEKMDRLYYIYHTDDAFGQQFELVGRMDYNGKSVFIQLNANCDFTGFDCDGGGTIFISLDANLFMKTIFTNQYPLDLIRQSLAEDGIDLDEIDEYDKHSRMVGANVPMLKYLCHLTVHEHKEKLIHYHDVLPKILMDSIDDFIRVKEAKKDYDDWD